MGSSVPLITFGDKGPVLPDETTQILPAVQADIDAAMGGGLNPSLETPQGQLASSIAALIGNVNDTFLKMVSLFDPAYSYGRYQDAIGRIYFIERIGAAPTIVQCVCSGAAGVKIPAGSTAVASDGNIYFSTSDGTIDVSGTASIPFACQAMGPITCPAGSLNQIYRYIPGWDSITNPADGVLGRDTETRAQFENRRSLSVAQNANGSLPAILGAVLNVSGVIDAFVTENNENTSQNILGVTIPANSIYVAAVGGSSSDVARAIWSRKAPGCGYSGNTTVTVYDQNAAYNPPYPAYSVTFEIPPAMPVIFEVGIANSALVPANAVDLIQNAIIQAFSGNDGGPRARIGSAIYASRFYGPISMLGPWAQIVNVKVGCQNNASSAFNGTISGTSLTVNTLTSGSLAIGQTVLGAGVLDGTVIIAGSGTSWTVNKTQTVGPVTMYGCLANLDDINARIDQAPAVSADGIVVTLI